MSRVSARWHLTLRKRKKKNKSSSSCWPLVAAASWPIAWVSDLSETEPWERAVSNTRSYLFETDSLNNNNIIKSSFYHRLWTIWISFKWLWFKGTVTVDFFFIIRHLKNNKEKDHVYVLFKWLFCFNLWSPLWNCYSIRIKSSEN